jgi:hypothetical protein
MDKELLEWIHRKAERRHISVAQVIRNLIVDAMEIDAAKDTEPEKA